jgi:probable HAF family extracellular repeat protein
MEDLGTLPGVNFSQARGVSADGSVVVGWSNRAFRWTAAGGMEDLGTLAGGFGSVASDVSADGSTVVGYSTSSGGARAVRWITCVPCPADFNGDGFLDFFDYDAFVEAYETSGGLETDFNGDGFVDFFDYDAFVAAFEAGC